MRWLLWPLGIVYSQLSKMKNLAYDKGLKRVHSVGVPVVSVGNITAGGTGKTPVIDSIVSWATQENLKVGIVSRGYKGQFEGVALVDITKQELGADYFGDEPYMLALRHPNVPVYVGADRVEAARKLVSEYSLDFIVADDGFQHRRLGRIFDLVILDAMEPLSSYLPLPVGMGREPLASVLRADLLVLNKVNLAPMEEVVNLTKTLSGIWEGLDLKPPSIAFGEYKLRKIYNASNKEALWMKGAKSSLLVSGIGRPTSFEGMLKLEGVKFEKHIKFKDHYQYSQIDVAEILNEMKAFGLEQIITTEKDAVKLSKFPELSGCLWTAELELKFSDQIEEMYEVLRRKLR